MASSENTPTGGNSNVNGLLTINRLNYTLPNDLSVCISRTGTNQFFQAKTYSPSQNRFVFSIQVLVTSIRNAVISDSTLKTRVSIQSRLDKAQLVIYLTAYSFPDEMGLF